MSISYVQNNLAGAFDEESAIAAFSSKFKSKTGNAWDKRDLFVHKTGKYDIVEIDEVRLMPQLTACAFAFGAEATHA